MASTFVALSNDGYSYGEPAGVDFANNSAFAIAVWVTPTTFLNDGNEDNFVAKGYDGTNTAYQLYLDSTTTIKIGSYNGSLHGVGATHGWSTGTLHHVVGQYTGSQWEIYLDGGAPTISVDAIGPVNTNVIFTLGYVRNEAGNQNLQYMDGTLAEVGVWSRGLGAGEIAALAKGYAPALFARGLEFYAPLVRGTNDVVGGATVQATLGAPSVSNHPRIIMPPPRRKILKSTFTAAAQLRAQIWM